jgi:hypothetical protein
MYLFLKMEVLYHKEAVSMKCYECLKNEKDSDTLAICIICGRGVCKQHLVREETPLWEGEYSIKLKCGMGVECKYEDIQHTQKILCRPCHEALKENYR